MSELILIIIGSLCKYRTSWRPRIIIGVTENSNWRNYNEQTLLVHCVDKYLVNATHSITTTASELNMIPTGEDESTEIPELYLSVRVDVLD
jgi:hypothetical protein